MCNLHRSLVQWLGSLGTPESGRFNNWTLYLDDRSPNHKESIVIMRDSELEDVTGISGQTLITIHPATKGGKETLMVVEAGDHD